MDWVSIGSAAICGALATGVTELVAHRLKLKRGLGYALILGLIFTGLNGFVRQAILPEVRARQAANVIEKNPVYQAVRRLEPDKAAELEKLFASIARGGDGIDHARAMLRAAIAELGVRYASTASDQSVIRLITVSVENSSVLRQLIPHYATSTCFPNPESGPTSHATFPSGVEREIAALVDVLMTAAEQPQDPPTEKDVLPAFEGVVQRLERRFGSKTLALLDQATTLPAEAPRICTVGIAMFKEIMALPRERQGPILRYLFLAAGES